MVGDTMKWAITGEVDRIVTNSWMQTYSGRILRIFDPDLPSVCIEDIAHALSMKCRFGGHCKKFYSVAEHSVHMSRAHRVATHHDMAKQICMADKRGFLMHDIGEYALPDVVPALKRRLWVWTPTGMMTFKDFEMKLVERLIHHLRINSGISEEIVIAWHGETVKWYDMRMLALERDIMMEEPDEDWGAMADPIEGVIIKHWSPEQAKVEFLIEYEKLMEVKHDAGTELG